MSKYQALLFAFIIPVMLSAQEEAVFHHFTTEQGLPRDNITCLLQDKKGFLWIGTDNGLCRYNGSRFLNYKNDPADSFSISNSNITCLSLDDQGRIWAGTWRGGLNMLDEKANQFIHFKNQENKRPVLGNNFVPGAVHLDSTHIAIAQGDDLVILDTKNKNSGFIELPKNTWSEKFKTMIADTFTLYGLFIDHEKKWWLTGEAGLVVYDPAKKKWTCFQVEKMCRKLFEIILHGIVKKTTQEIYGLQAKPDYLNTTGPRTSLFNITLPVFSLRTVNLNG